MVEGLHLVISRTDADLESCHSERRATAGAWEHKFYIMMCCELVCELIKLAISHVFDAVLLNIYPDLISHHADV